MFFISSLDRCSLNTNKPLTFLPTPNDANKFSYVICNMQTLQTCNINRLHTCTLATYVASYIIYLYVCMDDLLSTNEHFKGNTTKICFLFLFYYKMPMPMLYIYILQLVCPGVRSFNYDELMFCLLTSRKPQFGQFKQPCFCVSIQALKIHHPPFIITESINNSLDFGNFVPSLAVFRSLSYFRASTYTACIKIK